MYRCQRGCSVLLDLVDQEDSPADLAGAREPPRLGRPAEKIEQPLGGAAVAVGERRQAFVAPGTVDLRPAVAENQPIFGLVEHQDLQQPALEVGALLRPWRSSTSSDSAG